jgi:hypothetical protein
MSSSRSWCRSSRPVSEPQVLLLGSQHPLLHPILTRGEYSGLGGSTHPDHQNWRNTRNKYFLFSTQ